MIHGIRCAGIWWPGSMLFYQQPRPRHPGFADVARSGFLPCIDPARWRTGAIRGARQTRLHAGESNPAAARRNTSSASGWRAPTTCPTRGVPYLSSPALCRAAHGHRPAWAPSWATGDIAQAQDDPAAGLRLGPAWPSSSKPPGAHELSHPVAGLGVGRVRGRSPLFHLRRVSLPRPLFDLVLAARSSSRAGFWAPLLACSAPSVVYGEHHAQRRLQQIIFHFCHVFALLPRPA